MIVRLTHHQARSVTHRVGWAAEMMDNHWEKAGRTSRDYDLPAIAWRKILDDLVDMSYGPLGGKRDTNPDSLYRAIARIQAMVMWVEHHPALTGTAIEGWVSDVLPAWQLTDVRFSCYPLLDSYPHLDPAGFPLRDFVLLVPQPREYRGMQVTRWFPGELPDDAAPSWTFESNPHLLITALARP